MPTVYPAARRGLFPVARDLQAAKMSGKVLYDAKDRVMIQVVVVVDATDVPSFNCMALYKLLDLNYIAAWDGGIPGNTLAEQYAFIYDALVEEAKEQYYGTRIKPF
ncbi:hypothetical protein K504DRAFT_447449 [Pleomassaria siparia CBS 279.74]|uniref:Uncharacterized protein n=1 Tax=Pleomassaria siparia CBS 279.74 TaxID=1314801 RepID=A0A6G1JQ68_9PLEO|nr:hypothetical protein K504DRAFT_447449 [Pleomassaria siparia CBS 279.74]